MSMCIAKDCNSEDYYAKGLCTKHYKEMQYYQHIDQHKETAKKWREKNRTEETLSYKRKDSKKLTRRLTRCKTVAKQKGLPYTITLEFYEGLINKGCHYCGIALTDMSGHCMDRIDNSNGYTQDNVLPACGTCNCIRGDALTVEEAEIAIKAVLGFRKERSII